MNPFPAYQEVQRENKSKKNRSKKIFKPKKYTSTYYERKLMEAANNYDYKGEKKRVYTKRTTEKIRRWTKEEAEAYEKFIDMYSDIFNESGSKRVTKVFIQMSQYIGTKTPSQCRSHHQKFFKRLQRARMIAAGQHVNEDDFKKKKKNGLKNKKKKEKSESEANLGGNGSELSKENNSFSKHVATTQNKEERAAENGNSTHEIGDSYMINSNFVINNNVYYENPYVIHNYNGNYMGYPGVENRNPYLRKTSFGDDKDFAALLENKSRRKSSFTFICNNNQNEQDFSNFEKICFSTYNNPQPNSHPSNFIQEGGSYLSNLLLENGNGPKRSMSMTHHSKSDLN